MNNAVLTFVVLAAAAARPRHPETPAPVGLWATALVDGGLAHNATFGTPTPFGDNQIAVYAVDSSGVTAWLCVVDAGDGSVRWRVALPFVQAQSGWVAAGTLGAGGEPALFAGTDAGVVAFLADTGAEAWRHTACGAPQPVPAHPTFAGDSLFYTFENGADSSPLTVLDAATGAVRWQTSDLAFSLIWPVAQRAAVVYMSYVPPSRVAVVCRSFDSAPVWARTHLVSTGLNNNPNLDVGAVGDVLLYSKPATLLRNLTLLNRDTGATLWDVAMTGDVEDYDTYAYGGLYYRLTSITSSVFMLQAFDLTGSSIFQEQFFLNDTDAILLVGGPAAFVFAPNANTVSAFDRTSGRPLWVYGGAVVPNDGQVSLTNTTLVFGDGQGILRGLQIAAREIIDKFE